jgi:putative tryptophan/tyrosine transport system substrate-binding protein
MGCRAAIRATLAIAVVLAALTAQAQPVRRVPVVGVLRPHALDSSYPAFVDGLRDLGYEDGRTVRLVVRSADMKLERLSGLAKELVDAHSDVIVAITTPGTRAAIEATRTIPIVMALVGDPVGMGFVKNLSRPGANVTGVSNLTVELVSKRLQIVKEVVPAAKRVAVMFNPDDPVTTTQVRQTSDVAPRMAVEVRFFPVRTHAALPTAFKAAAGEWHADAVMWLAGQSDAFMAPTIELATGRKLPAMFPNVAATKMGALLAYAADHREQYRRAAAYVDKLIKGARPADVPVEQPTKFVLSVNLKVARAIGVTIPQSILLQADEVIQ